ncbi:RidA family protein [Rhizobium ruizarguesonis]|uniref:RidA family protein n=1 Tax=Rhizobium ruizarguesonis TaxID=2081791 RepID=UPI001031F588|nr:RidA family protein [Rhizobium ruizarguesonis]TAU31109.1 RidA family protein [Rhizobium ruizarguesonis]
MSRTIIASSSAPAAPAAYSQAVKAAGLVFVSGTAPIDPASGKLVDGPVQAQVAQCLTNIAAILAEAGSSLTNAVSATLIVADEEDFAPASEEWERWFPVDPPARQGAKMPVRVPGLKISIAMIALA